ncbi:uncharacterized protein LOC111299058 isoform X1 [Durio zibethinus]|uniref:Uncharacterized protein LOC111299058 isoform X1 n=1 Tax=Durio zibethinus TaxID=66656 RepID=A0A6P5ZB75_DURZI|nr:uncharacterized protein LOC111299058 isoform X1 [Durio zibethinus]
MAKNVAQSANLASLDQKLAMAKRCSHEGVAAGAKAAIVASMATAIPTLASVRMLPWARTNLNHTAQALIISTGFHHHHPLFTSISRSSFCNNFLLLIKFRLYYSGWSCLFYSCRQDRFGYGTEELLQACL